MSAQSSESEEELPPVAAGGELPAKKAKRKKKKKKSAAARAAAEAPKPAPITLKISRAKHWKYISSYHGQWLQLPNELIDTLLSINCNTSTRYDHFDDVLPVTYAEQMGLMPIRSKERRKDSLPPPIDKAVFLGVSTVRKLIEAASDLALRAASGLSAAAHGAFSDNPPPYSGHDHSPLSPAGGRNNGRSQYMSANRQLRLRAMAVSKLAEAYKIDEIAASVAVMQGSTALDDLAERVLKQDPSNTDAKYVQFFHEKIPSRTLAQSTTTAPLEALIAIHPNKLEYYRTCGIVHAAKHDFAEAIQVYSQALAIARTMRRGKDDALKKSAAKKSKKGKHRDHQPEKAGTEGDASTDTIPEGGSVAAIEEADAVGLEAGDDCERQIFFLRGMSYFQWAFNMLETATLKIEGLPDSAPGVLLNEGGEASLEGLGVKDARLHEKGLLDTPEKREAYAAAFADPDFKAEIMDLFARAAKDHERYISYFPVYHLPKGSPFEVDRRSLPPVRSRRAREDKFLSAHMQRILAHRSLEGRTSYSHPVEARLQDEQALLTTYHPLLTESYFTLLISTLMLGDFSTAVKKHYTTASLLSNLEGFPVFLPSRSMNQAQYSEILERLATTWLADREAAGLRPPRGNEDEIARLGHVESLHHLASFFTMQHDQLIELAADRAAAQKEAEGAAKTKAPLQITNGGSGESSASPSPSTSTKVPLSARGEIASAWLQVAIIPALDEHEHDQEEEPVGNGTSTGSSRVH